MGGLVYLDHAATSHPKPPAVLAAVTRSLVAVGANAGRSGHRLAAEAARGIFAAREAVAALLGVSDSRRVVFTANATEGLNAVLFGVLRPGDHVVSTALEHNAVGRPLAALRARGVGETVVAADAQGRVDPGAVRAALTARTRLVVVNHASNVTGTIQPLAAIRAAIGRVPLLLDAAQTAGAVPLAVDADGVDFLACSGHKSLLGPQGTGVLVVPATAELPPLLYGGTGSRSESDEQPPFLPDRLEAGTRNGPGIAGLAAGVGWLQERGVARLRAEEIGRFGAFLDGLRAIPRVRIVGPAGPEERTATVSVTVAGMTASEVGRALDRDHGVLCRVGLHCAPRAHRALGTFPGGTVRLAAGPFVTADELARAAAALAEVAGRGASAGARR